jgi:hypothetical protein
LVKSGLAVGRCTQRLFSSTSLWIDTMNRCNEILARLTLAACAALAAGSLILPTAAWAQGIQREAPKDVVLGKLVVTAPPEIILDGKLDRLSPGSRIRDLNNMLVLSGSVVGKTLPVVYRRDAAGLVHEAWILTDEEYGKLGGAAAGGADGSKRFAELLAVIFGARR